jgi:molecular chaperone GrpE
MQAGLVSARFFMPKLTGLQQFFQKTLEIFVPALISRHRHFKNPENRMSDPTFTSSQQNQPEVNTGNAQSANDITAAMANFEADALTKCQADLAELQAKSAELADQYLRAKAEAENARRRAEDEISKARKFAVEGFADSLLPVLDSLEAGLNIKDATLEHIREGAQATLRQLTSALERNKVVAINPAANDKFDPHLHQAISMVPADQEANTIVTVLQKGYLIADRILRPALVTVAAAK